MHPNSLVCLAVWRPAATRQWGRSDCLPRRFVGDRQDRRACTSAVCRSLVRVGRAGATAAVGRICGPQRRCLDAGRDRSPTMIKVVRTRYSRRRDGTTRPWQFAAAAAPVWTEPGAATRRSGRAEHHEGLADSSGLHGRYRRGLLWIRLADGLDRRHRRDVGSIVRDLLKHVRDRSRRRKRAQLPPRVRRPSRDRDLGEA